VTDKERRVKKNDHTIADEILQGLTEFANALDTDEDLGERFTCHRVKLNLQPEVYTPEKVRETRKALRVSQPLFGSFLGVSVKTVRSWEQGDSTPSNIACRFMDEIRRDPEHYLKRLTDSIEPKTRKKPCI
jgi:putative transcriptional regulator